MWLSGKPGSLKENLAALPPFWRSHVEEVEAFKHTCHGLIIKLLVCFALAMNLPDRNFFAKAHAEDAGEGNRFRSKSLCLALIVGHPAFHCFEECLLSLDLCHLSDMLSESKQ